MIEFSVVIPFSPKEDLLLGLLKDLEDFPLKNSMEIILVGESDLPIPKNFKKYFLKSPLGRAVQLNIGAYKAKGKFLWFLHADSRIDQKDFMLFYEVQKKYPNDLTYFNLKFDRKIKKLFFNQIGTKIRSDLFKLPFGDQGLGLSKENFEKLGGFPLVPIGEDLAFVCMARKKGLNLRNNGANIYTSSRKYEKNGWIKTTLNHLFYTTKLFFSFWFGAKTI